MVRSSGRVEHGLDREARRGRERLPLRARALLAADDAHQAVELRLRHLEVGRRARRGQHRASEWAFVMVSERGRLRGIERARAGMRSVQGWAWVWGVAMK